MCVTIFRKMHLQYFYTHRYIRTYCGKLVKLPEELVQQFDQLLSCALRSQTGKPNNVCKQDTKRKKYTED